MRSILLPLALALLAAAAPLLVAADDMAMPTIERFEAGGWTPPDEASARAAATFLVELVDQNGCRIIVHSDEPETLAEFALKTEERLECGANGYASGISLMIFEQADGELFDTIGPLAFSNGFAFSGKLQSSRLVASNDDRVLWFYLAGDAGNRTHFLQRAEPIFGVGLVGLWRASGLDAVTDDEDTFRDSERVEALVDAAFAAQERAGAEESTYLPVRFFDDFERGVSAGDRSHLAYLVYGGRSADVRTGVIGDWQIQGPGGRNFVLLQDVRDRQRRLAAERRAPDEERQDLALYRRLQELAESGGPDAVREHIEIDLRLDGPPSHQDYARLVNGVNTARFRRIVHVAGPDGEDARIDRPYEMRLAYGNELAPGWYWISSHQALDPERLDDAGLPLTVLSGASRVTPCREAGCRDQLTPLATMRVVQNDPEWTPE